MRSVPSGSFERLTSAQALWRAWGDCRRGKRRRPAVAAFDLDAPARLFALRRSLLSGRYQPAPHRLFVARDPKIRLVAAPAMRDRILHQALIQEIGPTFQQGFIDQTFSCGHGRGPHRAALTFLRWNRVHAHRLCLDIRRFFPSIHRPTLEQLITRRLRDAATRKLVSRLLASGEAVYRDPLTTAILNLERDPLPPDCGMPLGGLLSHWCGDLYLDGLDHFVKRQLKIRAYLRYMDDFALFHDDPERLAEARDAIAHWLARHRGLGLKPMADPLQPCAKPALFLGLRISRAGLRPGPKAIRRLRNRLWDAPADTRKLARGLMAWKGVFFSLG